MPPVAPGSGWDNVFGGWRSLVSYVEDQLHAWLDEYDGALDILSAVVNLLAVFPQLDLIGVDALMQFFEGVNDAGSNTIRAGMTNALMDDLACSGFCIMYNENDKTLRSEYLDQWEQQEHTILAPAKWAMLEVAERLELAKKTRYYELGRNDPDADWAILCTCGTEPEVNLHYTGVLEGDSGGAEHTATFSAGLTRVDVHKWTTGGTHWNWNRPQFPVSADAGVTYIALRVTGDPGYEDWHDIETAPQFACANMGILKVWFESYKKDPVTCGASGPGEWILEYTFSRPIIPYRIGFEYDGMRWANGTPEGTHADLRIEIIGAY